MSDDELKVCPECGSSSIKVRTGKRPDLVEEGDTARYRCDSCNHKFSTPDTRPPERDVASNAGGLSAGGKALDAMNPDDWPPEEGPA